MGGIDAGSHTLAWTAVGLAMLGLAAWVLVLWRRSGRLRSRLRAARTELAELRERDALTGLPGRAAFDAALDAATQACDSGTAPPLAVLLVGLDGLRALNDVYGHPAGDALLRETARRLQAACKDLPGGGASAHTWRLSGDEFALIAPADAAGALAAELLRSVQQPCAVNGARLALGASIGIALYPEHGARGRLPSLAALAMRSVKELGGSGHAVYDPAMAVDQRQQAELLQDLRHAIARGELTLVYQPKVDARSLQVTAAEALLRWQHPRRGTVSPAVFIPLAERHGLIHAIGRWVVEEACRQAAAWRGSGLRMRVAVNISGLQLRSPELVEHLLHSLQQHQVPPARFTCEITETVAMEDTEQSRAAFQRLREAGLHVSIDDFGTGHSSLASLRRLPAAELKIDRAFVSDLDATAERGECAEQSRSIVAAIVQVARTLRLRVVAEGVETVGQRDALVALGVDEMQGYLFAKPMSATALALWADGDDQAPAGHAAFRPSLFTETEPVTLERTAPR